MQLKFTIVEKVVDLRFKYALAYLLRGARHALHDILLLRTSAIRRRLYLGRRLDSHQDEFVLLATYRGGSLISFQDKNHKEAHLWNKEKHGWTTSDGSPL